MFGFAGRSSAAWRLRAGTRSAARRVSFFMAMESVTWVLPRLYQEGKVPGNMILKGSVLETVRKGRESGFLFSCLPTNCCLAGHLRQ